MTDIVERLRRMATMQFAQYDHDAINEAAEQIEGLRDEIRNAYRAQIAASQDWEQAMRRVTELEQDLQTTADALSNAHREIEQSAPGWDAQAYASMRDEIEHWKRKAAESDEALDRIRNDLGPTHMGEPVIAAPVDEREAFESRFPSAKGCRIGLVYTHQRDHDRWEAWQARAQLEAVPEGCALIPLTERMPDPDKHPRVVVYTEGTDFAGEQFFDVQAESLNEWFYEYPEDQPEVCRYATHWIGADELAARAQLGAVPAGPEDDLAEQFEKVSSAEHAAALTATGGRDDLLEALESIRQYGTDTLSGRVDGPDDRAWQRAAVNEMTKRARLAIAAAQPAQEKSE